MTVRVYRSSDASAPVLTGQAGTLLAILDACLVAGYGSNAAAGWTKPFVTALNVAIYRPPMGNRRYLRIDDTTTTDARIHAFESMTSDTDFSTSFTVGVFGAITSTTGLQLKKSSTADATTRGWVVIATQTAVYIFIEPTSIPAAWGSTSTSTSGNGQMFFGDFISYRPNDAYNTALIGSTSSSAGQGALGSISTSITTGATGHVLTRNYLGLGSGGTLFHKGVPGLYSSLSVMGQASTSNPFPDVITGGIMLSQVEIGEITSSAHIVRGRLPGVWAPITSLPASHGDVIEGTGIAAGKTLLTVAVWSTFTVGRMFIEISDTW